MKLTGFLASTNGNTVVYRRASATRPIGSVLRANGDSEAGRAHHLSRRRHDSSTSQFTVSSDGQWIAAVARDGSNVDAAYVVNVSSPSTVTKVSIPGAVRASLPVFRATRSRSTCSRHP